MDMNKHIVHNLEEKIADCWNVTSEIKLVYEEYMDSATPMSEDELMNILVGIEYLYERKFNRMNEAFEKICAHGGVWLSDEQVATITDYEKKKTNIINTIYISIQYDDNHLRDILFIF